MMVEIEQVALSDLAIGARVKALKNIDPTKFAFFSPDIPDERCVFMSERFVNFGFGNCVNFQDDNTFWLNLLSDIPAKVAHQGLYQNQAWGVFNISNLSIVKRGYKMESHGQFVFSLQGYMLELPAQCNYGYIQLYSIPEILRNEGQVFKQHSLLHISVYRQQSDRARRASPELITVKPDKIPLYVPLVPGQCLQLITPERSRIDASGISLQPVGTEDKQLIHGGRVRSTIYRCTKLQERSEFILVNHGKRTQSLVVLPGIMTNNSGDLYPYMTEPAKECGIICNNMAGFIFIEASSGIKDWLFDDDVADVAPDDEETVVTFTKSQRYVTVEPTHGYWWLAAHPQYAVEKL